jgi:molybdopterin synthase sulfur carrier subunit
VKKEGSVDKVVRVTVKFFTFLRELVGKREEIIELSGRKVTVKELLERLADRYGEDFCGYVFDPISGELREHLQLLVNGRNVISLQGLSTELKDGDVFAIIPPVGGG